MTDLLLLKVLNAVNRGLAFLLPLFFAGVWHWTTARGQSRKNTFFGVRVEPGFGESTPGLAILHEFRRRLWSSALLAAIGSVGVSVRLASFVGPLITIAAAYVAFGRAHRRTKREATAPIEPTVRIAPLAADDDAESVWLNVIDGLAMVVPPLMPAATLIFLNLHWEQMGADKGMGLFLIALNLILGLCCSANQWALLFRARSRDWAPTPGASHKYRTYSGAMMSIVFTGIGLQSCLYALIALKDTAGWMSRINPSAFLGVTFLTPIPMVILFWRIRFWLRSHLATESSDPMSDACWKWGWAYFNPADPALVVPARTGVDFSYNYARPSVLVVFGSIMLVTVVSLAYSFMLLARVGHHVPH